VFFCPVLEIKKLGHPKVKTEYTVSLRGDVEAVAPKQICKHTVQRKEEIKREPWIRLKKISWFILNK